MTNDMQFPGLGERLKAAVRARGTVREFVEAHPRPEYREGYVYAWFKRRLPEFDTLRLLAADLDVPLSYLLLGELALEEIDALTTLARARKESLGHAGNVSYPADLKAGAGSTHRDHAGLEKQRPTQDHAVDQKGRRRRGPKAS